MLGGSTSSSCATLQCPALIFAQPTPDTRVLVGIKGVLEAVLGHGAVRADRFGAVDLIYGRTGVPDGEKKLRINGKASCFVAPVHGLPNCFRKG